MTLSDLDLSHSCYTAIIDTWFLNQLIPSITTDPQAHLKATIDEFETAETHVVP